MKDGFETERLIDAVRRLSANIDAVALEFGRHLTERDVTELRNISVLLCNTADHFENPSLTSPAAHDPDTNPTRRH